MTGSIKTTKLQMEIQRQIKAASSNKQALAQFGPCNGADLLCFLHLAALLSRGMLQYCVMFAFSASQ